MKFGKFMDFVAKGERVDKVELMDGYEPPTDGQGQATRDGWEQDSGTSKEGVAVVRLLMRTGVADRRAWVEVQFDPRFAEEQPAETARAVLVHGKMKLDEFLQKAREG